MSPANSEDGYIDVEQRRPSTLIHYIVANGQQTSMHSENSIKNKTITHTIEIIRRRRENLSSGKTKQCTETIVGNALTMTNRQVRMNAHYTYNDKQWMYCIIISIKA